MVLCQEFSFTWDLCERTAFSGNSKFGEKRVNHIMKGSVLLRVKFSIQWNYRNVNKLSWKPPVKIPGISSMCYGIIINQFKWF